MMHSGDVAFLSSDCIAIINGKMLQYLDNHPPKSHLLRYTDMYVDNVKSYLSCETAHMITTVEQSIYFITCASPMLIKHTNAVVYTVCEYL